MNELGLSQYLSMFRNPDKIKCKAVLSVTLIDEEMEDMDAMHPSHVCALRITVCVQSARWSMKL